jgi:hypothetical protein
MRRWLKTVTVSVNRFVGARPSCLPWRKLSQSKGGFFHRGVGFAILRILEECLRHEAGCLLV